MQKKTKWNNNEFQEFPCKRITQTYAMSVAINAMYVAIRFIAVLKKLEQ